MNCFKFKTIVLNLKQCFKFKTIHIEGLSTVDLS